jgi:3-hydroxymyristoyl/3-hydroxydecanoyl-(acyl carrier protein) dehydratase
MLSEVQPGQTLELAADLDTVDMEAVSYGGTASVGGKPVIRLEHCVGPMMPLEEFDDPQALRSRFAVLCGSGATPGGFGGIPPLAFVRTNGEPGQSVRATLQVPGSAPFFGDHFPRRPVFPGTLLMHLNLQLVAALAAEIPAPAGGCWHLKSVSDMKLRAFIPPGENLELEVKLDERADDSATVIVETRKGKKLVGGARALLVREQIP